MDGKPVLHVVFGMSAAGSLRQVLEMLGRAERVIGCLDDLSFGPINPGDAPSRNAYLNSIWCNEAGDEWEDWVGTFWDDAADSAVLPVAWVNRRAAYEYANFLQFLHCLNGAPCEVVDMTEVPFHKHDGTTGTMASFGIVTPKMMIDADVLSLRTQLEPAQRDAHATMWARLREENAMFRLATPAGLVSAPEDVFDPLILKHVTSDWQRAARVVGDALGQQLDEPYRQVGDNMLWHRLQALADAGLVEGRGDMLTLRGSEVRLVA